MSANPTKEMAKNFNVLNKIANGIILCQYKKKYLAENIIVLPIAYI